LPIHVTDDGSIEYEVVRSDRATRARIDAGIRGIKVVIPRESDMDPETLIEDKRDWIETKLETIEKRRQKIPDRQFEEGATWPYLGQKLQLALDEFVKVRRGKIRAESGGNSGNRETDGKPANKIVLNRNRVENHSIRDELEYFYREAARDHITTLVDQWTNTLDVTYDTIYIRNQRTKWASCSSKSNLNFNFRLMMAPPEIVEYIVTHECCHLIQPNHGPRFNRLLSRYAPNHGSHERWLDENSPKLIFTESDL